MSVDGSQSKEVPDGQRPLKDDFDIKDIQSNILSPDEEAFLKFSSNIFNFATLGDKSSIEIIKVDPKTKLVVTQDTDTTQSTGSRVPPPWIERSYYGRLPLPARRPFTQFASLQMSRNTLGKDTTHISIDRFGEGGDCGTPYQNLLIEYNPDGTASIEGKVDEGRDRDIEFVYNSDGRITMLRYQNITEQWPDQINQSGAYMLEEEEFQQLLNTQQEITLSRKGTQFKAKIVGNKLHFRKSFLPREDHAEELIAGEGLLLDEGYLPIIIDPQAIMQNVGVMTIIDALNQGQDFANLPSQLDAQWKESSILSALGGRWDIYKPPVY